MNTFEPSILLTSATTPYSTEKEQLFRGKEYEMVFKFIVFHKLGAFKTNDTYGDETVILILKIRYCIFEYLSTSQKNGFFTSDYSKISVKATLLS